MNLKKAWLAIPVGAALALSACSGGTNANAVVMNGSEPQNPLLPGLTNENGGGKILTQIFSELVRYDVDGNAVLDVAESIEPNEDNTLWTVKLHQDRKFSDGTPSRPRTSLEPGTSSPPRARSRPPSSTPRRHQ